LRASGTCDSRSAKSAYVEQGTLYLVPSRSRPPRSSPISHVPAFAWKNS